MDALERRRAQGRERSRRYYARIKALTGRTHPERILRDTNRTLPSMCGHGCNCREFTTDVVCGFCVEGWCE